MENPILKPFLVGVRAGTKIQKYKVFLVQKYKNLNPVGSFKPNLTKKVQKKIVFLYIYFCTEPFILVQNKFFPFRFENDESLRRITKSFRNRENAAKTSKINRKSQGFQVNPNIFGKNKVWYRWNLLSKISVSIIGILVIAMSHLAIK